MSENLRAARTHLSKAALAESYLNKQVEYSTALWLLLLHIEALEKQPAPVTATLEPSSSEATPTVEAMTRTWIISSTWSSPVNLHGELMLSAVADIVDWLSSRTIPGNVQGVEIGVILTSRASTPPPGSLSLSTGEPAPAASGLAGEEPHGCHAGRDGDCIWSGCPQLRDHEPIETGRHCPLDRSGSSEGEAS